MRRKYHKYITPFEVIILGTQNKKKLTILARITLIVALSALALGIKEDLISTQNSASYTTGSSNPVDQIEPDVDSFYEHKNANTNKKGGKKSKKAKTQLKWMDSWEIRNESLQLDVDNHLFSSPSFYGLFHLHTPKTGGSSFCEHARTCLGSAVQKKLYCRPKWGLGVHATLPHAQRELIKINRHIHNRYKHQSNTFQPRGVIVMTVAEPVARTVSEYNHCLRLQPNPKTTNSKSCFDGNSTDYVFTSDIDLLDFARKTANRQVRYWFGCNVSDYLGGPRDSISNSCSQDLVSKIEQVWSRGPAMIPLPRGFEEENLKVMDFFLFPNNKCPNIFPHVRPATNAKSNQHNSTFPPQLAHINLPPWLSDAILKLNRLDLIWYCHAIQWLHEVLTNALNHFSEKVRIAYKNCKK